MVLRQFLGALARDGIRFERHVRGRWELIHNRRELITPDPEGRGVRCEWQWSSTVDYCRFVPRSGERLMQRAFGEWPLGDAEAPASTEAPEVSFIIGHRGLVRLPLLMETLRTLARQRRAECIVVEQAPEREIELPAWVRHVHQQVAADVPYNRAAAFNLGAVHAGGRILVLHDNDMLAPSSYAAEIVRHADAGFEAIDLKRMTFYLNKDRSLFEIVQNVHGGSVAITREAYAAIGGFDEQFVGWGGEDLEFWERAETLRATRFGYLPFVHLWHPPQPEKLLVNDAPAIRRYNEVTEIPAAERIARLLRRGR